MSFGMGAFPTPASSYSMWGAGNVGGYNYNPIAGKVLMTTPSIRFPFIPGAQEVTYPGPSLLRPDDLPSLLDADIGDVLSIHG